MCFCIYSSSKFLKAFNDKGLEMRWHGCKQFCNASAQQGADGTLQYKHVFVQRPFQFYFSLFLAKMSNC